MWFLANHFQWIELYRIKQKICIEIASKYFIKTLKHSKAIFIKNTKNFLAEQPLQEKRRGHPIHVIVLNLLVNSRRRFQKNII